MTRLRAVTVIKIELIRDLTSWYRLSRTKCWDSIDAVVGHSRRDLQDCLAGFEGWIVVRGDD